MEGQTTEGKTAFRFTSHHLKDSGCVVYECPVSHVLREMPYAYPLINAHAYSGHSGIEMLNAPPVLQQAFSVIGAEKVRLQKMADTDAQTKKDANYGKRVLMRGK